jgi:RimJ/RimL family protein N-acetyltransferase
MQLASARLTIYPLSLRHLGLLLKGMRFLEEALRLAPSGCDLGKDVHEAMEALYENACKHPAEYLWFTNWQLIERARNTAIGSVCFMGAPNEQGEVEIGYALNLDFRGQGYMSEAVCAVTDWALRQRGVSAVLAKTDKENIKSAGVLVRAGFARFYTNDTRDFWKKSAPLSE